MFHYESSVWVGSTTSAHWLVRRCRSMTRLPSSSSWAIDKGSLWWIKWRFAFWCADVCDAVAGCAIHLSLPGTRLIWFSLSHFFFHGTFFHPLKCCCLRSTSAATLFKAVKKNTRTHTKYSVHSSLNLCKVLPQMLRPTKYLFSSSMSDQVALYGFHFFFME